MISNVMCFKPIEGSCLPVPASDNSGFVTFAHLNDEMHLSDVVCYIYMYVNIKAANDFPVPNPFSLIFSPLKKKNAITYAQLEILILS